MKSILDALDIRFSGPGTRDLSEVNQSNFVKYLTTTIQYKISGIVSSMRMLNSSPETCFHSLFLKRDIVPQYLGAGCKPWILIFLVPPETTEEVAHSGNHPLEAKEIFSGCRCSHPVWGGICISYRVVYAYSQARG